MTREYMMGWNAAMHDLSRLSNPYNVIELQGENMREWDRGYKEAGLSLRLDPSSIHTYTGSEIEGSDSVANN